MQTTTNMWSRITVYCMNHEHPKKMSIAENRELIKTPFFACKYYFPSNQDEEHGYCPNRLNFDDYQGLVLKFFETVSNGPLMSDYTNYSFEYKGSRHKISVKVLIYSDDEIRLGILNRSVLGK
ncbi:MAG: hypothetical protein K6G10_06985 [Butyrivibrio sp.]|nr:hypothetical protein [Butyrivibrio sp.]